MTQHACVWCHTIVTVPADYDPFDPTKDVVCSPECAENERKFRYLFSDEAIEQWREGNGWHQKRPPPPPP
jgi:hypothetical protein